MGDEGVIGYVCDKCHAHHFTCVECGDVVLGDAGDELCSRCFSGKPEAKQRINDLSEALLDLVTSLEVIELDGRAPTSHLIRQEIMNANRALGRASRLFSYEQSVIRETITFNFETEEQQRAFHARLKGNTLMNFVLTADIVVVDQAGRRHVIKAGTTVTPVDRPAMPLDQ